MKLTPKRFKAILREYYSHSPPCKYVLAVDFDHTLCESYFPYCGWETPVANWLRTVQSDPKNDFVTIITTCRDGNISVDYAKEWLQEHGIRWDYFNENDPARIAIYKDCRKIYCNMLIDDTAWGFKMSDFDIKEECE